MIFNSLPFFIFFTIFFFLYWFVFNKNLKLQNYLLLIGSYIFYSWWDWRLLPLLIGYTSINYLLGYYIDKATRHQTKRFLVFLGTFTGIGLLFYFKYANFFITSLASAFAKFNINLNIHTMNIILPLGISFYTFRTLSYIIDIKNKKIKPTSDWVVFFSFVAFFPCLLSGPIDKAKTFIPQLERNRVFKYDEVADALRQILWGLFKKIVIADTLAEITDDIFSNYQHFSGSGLLIGAFYYSIQMYTDFSGYSDMAIGFGRLLGFDVTRNFNYPFFAQNVAEFWRRWHMSLTTWLTDYVFTPLSIAFRNYGKLGLILAIIINLTLIGIWHGANWTFALFGLLHGCYFIPLILRGTMNKKKKNDAGKSIPTFIEFLNMLKTFTLVTFALIIFRSDSVSTAFGFIKGIFSKSLLMPPGVGNPFCIPLIIAFLIIEWIQRDKQHVLQIQNIKHTVIRWGIYFSLLITIILVNPPDGPNNKAFIYIKF